MDDARALELWVEMAGRIFAARTAHFDAEKPLQRRQEIANLAAEDARLVFEAVEEVSGHSLLAPKGR